MKTIKFFEEDNSIIIDDDFSTNDFTFYPEDKKFTVSQSIKNDCFYNNQTFEYKISTNPIEMYMRTLESSHEPPLEYSIKDGVVLESEIKNKDMLFPDRLENLKKEVEWSKVALLGNCEVNLYILSRHPEIISKEEYRRFLRQSVERIKVGSMKVEEAVKVDNHGVEIYTSESGKSVWLKPPTKEEEKEIEQYWKLPEEKRLESKYGKKFDYAEKFNDSLFKEDSPKYVGISDYEYKISIELLDYLENLLNKKEIPNAKKEEDAPRNSKNGWKWIPIIVLTIIALSWGIWTAIGVFILGSIITNILSKQ